ncbi:MAG: VTT domain-containing protein [Xanthobacteraceae bacterium]|nr:VTT domain-containing protein [Xanthobacteraceae bacterium]
MSAYPDLPACIAVLTEWGLIGIAGIALAEKLLPVVPSYLVFVLLGTAASGHSDLAVTVAAAAAGSTLGALGWYCVGLGLGPTRVESLIERFGRYIFLKPALYSRMTGAYRRNHFWVTVAGQAIPAVRVYLSIPAGVLHLAVATFMAATLIGSLVWTGPLLTLGYFLRERNVDAASAGVLVVVALAGVELVVLVGWRLVRGRGSKQPQ